MEIKDNKLITTAEEYEIARLRYNHLLEEFTARGAYLKNRNDEIERLKKLNQDLQEKLDQALSGH